MELGADIYGHDLHFKIYESIGAYLSSETKKIGFLMFFVCL